MHSSFVSHTTRKNYLLLLIYVQIQCDLAITRNTRVNICSLNCLNLFLKYKIGQTCFLCVCVCVCVCLDLCMLCIYVERCFESLICCLDLWLSSQLTAFIFICFLQARQLLDKSSINSLSTRPFFFILDSILTVS